jgi:hypothetical protein
MKRFAPVLVIVLAACGATEPTEPVSTPLPSTRPDTLGMTVGEFQDRWNAEFDDLVDAGLDALVITEIDQRDTTFEARLSPLVRISGTTGADGIITSVSLWYSGEKGGIGTGSIEDGFERLEAVYAFETLPSVVIKSLSSDEANDVLTDMGWPEPTEGLGGISLDGTAGHVHFAVTDEGQSGILMTAEPAGP